MKLRYLILSLLLVLALMMTGCTDDKKDDNGDDIIEDDDTGDDEDDDVPDTGDYETLTIKKLLETPYSYSDKLVMVKDAILISVKTGYSSTISDDSTTETLTLYGYDEELGLKVGNVLDVKGIFEQYQNQYWEIKIRKNTDDDVKVTGSETVTYTEKTVKELLDDPDSFNGLLVRIVEAAVTDKESFYKFHISDDTSSDSLFVYNDGLFLKTFNRGDTIDIQGEFLKYKEDWELKLRNNTDDGITKVTEGSGDDNVTYNTRTVAELLAAPESFEDDHVRVVEAKVAWTDDDNTVSNTMFSIVDNTRGGTLTVVAFNKVAQEDVAKIVPGAIVTVKGEFTFYDKDKDKVKDEDEDWEIIVSSYTDSDSVKVVSEAEEIAYITAPSVAVLLDNATNGAYRDKSIILMNVTIVTMSDKYSYIFGVNDTAGPFNVNVTVYGFEAAGLAVNDTVTVSGLFEWYGDKGYWEIKIRSGTTDTVEKVTS